MSKKKKSIIGMLIVIVLACLFCLPLISKLGKKDKTTNTLPQPMDSWLTVIDCDVEYNGDGAVIALVSGVVKTNQEVDAIYVNVGGGGVEYLTFTSSLVQTSTETYFSHRINARKCLLGEAYWGSTTRRIDMYVEYGGLSHKVDSQLVNVIGMDWD